MLPELNFDASRTAREVQALDSAALRSAVKSLALCSALFAVLFFAFTILSTLLFGAVLLSGNVPLTVRTRKSFGSTAECYD